MLAVITLLTSGYSAPQADDWSYLCLGMKHGCVLAQHVGSRTGADGFYSTLEACENSCPQIGRDLSWECTETGNCEVATHPVDEAKGYYPSVQACAHAPQGRCFAPGSKTISYECHGAHFGCVPKLEQPDEKTKFASVDDCEQQCHVVPDGLAFGCSGSRPTGCVLLAHKPDPATHYFPGVEECQAYCSA